MYLFFSKYWTFIDLFLYLCISVVLPYTHLSCIFFVSPVCRGCCSALSPRWWRSYCHDWVSSSSWIFSVSPGRTERESPQHDYVIMESCNHWCICVTGQNMSQQNLHHPHLHFNTTLIHHTDTSTGTREDGRRERNVQRYATDRHRDTGYVWNRVHSVHYLLLLKNIMQNRTHYAMKSNSNSIMLHCCHMTLPHRIYISEIKQILIK